MPGKRENSSVKKRVRAPEERHCRKPCRRGKGNGNHDRFYGYRQGLKVTDGSAGFRLQERNNAGFQNRPFDERKINYKDILFERKFEKTGRAI